MYGAGEFLKIGNGLRLEFPTERQWFYGLTECIIGFSASNRSHYWSNGKLIVVIGGRRYVAEGLFKTG